MFGKKQFKLNKDGIVVAKLMLQQRKESRSRAVQDLVGKEKQVNKEVNKKMEPLWVTVNFLKEEIKKLQDKGAGEGPKVSELQAQLAVKQERIAELEKPNLARVEWRKLAGE